ncbi:MAG: hypothetical protein ACRY3E_05300 [Candidatus Lariskella arthropodorum]
MTVINIQWTDTQVLIGVIILSFLFFSIVNLRKLVELLTVIAKHPMYTITMGLCVLFILGPLFIAQKNGVFPVLYTLIYCTVFPAISYLYEKKVFRSLLLLVLLAITISFSPKNIYILVALIGPISGYFLLRTAKKLAQRTKINTTQMMFVRYFSLIFIAIFFIPFEHFSVANFQSTQIGKLLVITFLINIIPIYCAQYIGIIKDPNFFGKVIALLPFVTFIIQLMFYPLNTPGIYLILSVALAAIIFIFLLRRNQI